MKLSHHRMLESELGTGLGLPAERVAALARRFPDIRRDVASRTAAGEYGFLALGRQDGAVEEITRFAEGVGQAHDHVLVLGIGGSALGARALVDALRGPAWNEMDDEAREFFPRLTVIDNVDPTTLGGALRRIDPRRVLVNVVSKSGGTVETLAQYLVVRGWLEEALGPAAARHLVFTTDPERGALRETARGEGIATLDVPPAVGGRFSVLSPVGLLPAALVGIDIAGLLAGARRAIERSAALDLMQNPAALWAGLQWAADTTMGRRVQVLMAYSDRLRSLTAWFCQLWAESLGKRVDRDGTVVHTGPTPVGSVGAVDQHSLVQLLMEGPLDKTVTFLTVGDHGQDLVIPPGPDLPGDLARLAGHTLGELLAVEAGATEDALARAGRMSSRLELADLGAESIGETLMFFQLATGWAGAWYGVDPFSQPGVELGKELTAEALGRRTRSDAAAGA